MAVKLSIELSALSDPAVSNALATLVRALGPLGTSSAQTVISSANKSVSEPVAVAPKAGVAPKPAVAPVATPKKVGKSKPSALSADETIAGWTSFLERLPPRSQRFLMMIRQAGELTMSAAMAGLDIAQPKAMGGITGAIGRWAPARGLPVPYEAFEYNGSRAWRWLGLDTVEAAITKAQLDASAQSVAVAAPATKPVLVEPATKPVLVEPAKPSPKSAGRPKKRGPKKTNEAKAAPRAKPPEKRAPVKAKPPIKRAGRGKPVIGLTSANKPATPLPAPRVAKPVSRGKPAPVRRPTPAKPAPAKPALVAKPAPAVEAPPAPSGDISSLMAFRADLPEKSQAFLDLVAEHGRVSMPEALKFFGMSRSIAIGKVTEPIVRLARERGIELPYDSQRDATLGFRVWEWIGAR